MAREEFLSFQFENLVSSGGFPPGHLASGDMNIHQQTIQMPHLQSLSPKSKSLSYPSSYRMARNDAFPDSKDMDNKSSHIHNMGNNMLGNDVNNAMFSNKMLNNSCDMDNSNSNNAAAFNSNAFFNLKEIQFAPILLSGNENTMADAFKISTPSTHVNKNGFSISSSVQSDNSESVFSAPENPNSPDLDKLVMDSASKKSSPSTTSTPSNTRKVSKNLVDSNPPSKAKGGRTSHNMVEKKYRTNINSKIFALRDAVPSLRVAALGGSDPIDLEGLTPATKLNKASVLTKAAEYIHHLEKKNKQLLQEVEHLKTLCDKLAGNNKANNYPLNNNTNIADIPDNNCINLMSNAIRVPYFEMSNSMHPIHIYPQPATSAPHSHAPFQELQQQFIFNNNNFIQQQIMPQTLPTNMQQVPPQAPLQNHPAQMNEMSLPMKLAMGGMIGLMGTNLLTGGVNTDNDFRGLSSVPFVGNFFSKLNSNTELLFLFKLLMLIYCLYVFCIHNNHLFSTLFDDNNNKSNGFKYGSLFTKLIFQRIPFLKSFDSSSCIDDEAKVCSIITLINSNFFDKNSANKNSIFVLWDFYNTLSQYQDTKESLVYKSLLQKMIYQSGIVSRLLLKFRGAPRIVCDHDIIRMLTNVFYKKSISNSLTSCSYEETYINIVNDAVIEGNLVNVYRNFKANQIFRNCVELYLAVINASIENDDYERDSNDEKQMALQKEKQMLNDRLLEAQKLAVDDSILKLTIRLFSSLLNTEKVDQSTEFVKKAMKQVYKSDELNRTSMLNYSGNLFNYNAELKSWDESEQYQQHPKNKELLFTSEGEEEYNYDDDSTYVDHDFNEDIERSTYLKTMDVHDSFGCKFINAELHITLICCLISKYLNEKNFGAAEQSLMNLFECKNKYFIKARKEFTLLSFASIFKVLVDFQREADENIWEKDYGYAYESLVLCLRFWIGNSSEGSLFSGFDCIDSELRAAICDQLVELGTGISGTEISCG